MKNKASDRNNFYKISIKLLFFYGCSIFLLTSCKEKTPSEGGIQEVKSTTASIIRNPLSAQTATDTINIAKIKFDIPTFEFGTVKEGEKISHSFLFKNTGKVPLLISDARTTCGCTISDYPKHPIPPGQGGLIDAWFNTEGKSGAQHKSITVVANTMPSETEVFLKGEVKK
jgi:Protein of unknown function (DUF1573)